MQRLVSDVGRDRPKNFYSNTCVEDIFIRRQVKFMTRGTFLNLSIQKTLKCQKLIFSPWKVGIGATWRTLPVAPGITGGPMRPRNLLQPIRIPGATGGHRQIPTFHGLYLGKSGKMYFVQLFRHLCKNRSGFKSLHDVVLFT